MSGLFFGQNERETKSGSGKGGLELYLIKRKGGGRVVVVVALSLLLPPTIFQVSNIVDQTILTPLLQQPDCLAAASAVLFEQLFYPPLNSFGGELLCPFVSS